MVSVNGLIDDLEKERLDAEDLCREARFVTGMPWKVEERDDGAGGLYGYFVVCDAWCLLSVPDGRFCASIETPDCPISEDWHAYAATIIEAMSLTRRQVTETFKS